jgi:hypothetical protein
MRLSEMVEQGNHTRQRRRPTTKQAAQGLYFVGGCLAGSSVRGLVGGVVAAHLPADVADGKPSLDRGAMGFDLHKDRVGAGLGRTHAVTASREKLRSSVEQLRQKHLCVPPKNFQHVGRDTKGWSPACDHGWNPIETAPFDEDIALQVSDGRRGPYTRQWPCRRTAAGWIS